MIDDSYLTVLRTLHDRLADTDVTWALTGSLAFALQGVPLRPNDVDVQTDAAGAYAIERQFAPFVTRPVSFSTAERIRSHFGALRIDGITVEIMGAVQKRRDDGSWEPPVDVAAHRRFLDVAGMQIPVLSLEYEARAYRALGRFERVRQLERWLEGARDNE